MAAKKTHFGRAGEFFAMSELLLRGWNVAVPVVDVGDDVFVIDDRDKTAYRLQVKTAEATPTTETRWRAAVNLSRSQLRSPHANELFYMLVLRTERRWRFLVIPRERLHALRSTLFTCKDSNTARKGRPAATDEQARGDALTMVVEVSHDQAWAWGMELTEFLDCWPDALPELEAGPGATTRAPLTVEEALDPSTDHET